MSELYTMRLSEGSDEIAVFEVEEFLNGSDLELASGGGAAAKVRTTVQNALAQLRPMLASVADSVRQIGPDEAEIEFGLKMGGETGVVIAKGTSEVNFTVRMSWKRAAGA